MFVVFKFSRGAEDWLPVGVFSKEEEAQTLAAEEKAKSPGEEGCVAVAEIEELGHA